MALTNLLLVALVTLSISGACFADGILGSKPNLEKPKLGDGIFGSKPKLEKPKLDQKPKLGDSVFGSKPKLEKPKLDQKPKLEKPKSHVPDGKNLKPSFEKPTEEVKELYKTIGVQGTVYCQTGAKLVPLEGAVTKVTCCTIKNNGYESAPFTILSKPTDKKGYFIAKLPISELQSKSKIYKCKTYLHSSSLKSCNVPTDINKGLSGALPFSSSHILTNNKMKLYHAGQFVYTSSTMDKGY
ncbi:Pollen ole e 1 allergen and extensin family protein [Thalictrum thalictroides]|uniref:Pollen ole e 1 allergen and extensin family protein n=1 Tax=Thalictrum thalictroides TaxID=46969 RepID=A0A7J6X329_THATH|nr:Pollen ole e 1 allergen and extensin family protein [Thalictrum thalictroides]